MFVKVLKDRYCMYTKIGHVFGRSGNSYGRFRDCPPQNTDNLLAWDFFASLWLSLNANGEEKEVCIELKQCLGPGIITKFY